jgi:glycerophosphoryl diester phosphodiesterase
MTQIIAHRGSSFLAPENTLAAVELAWQEGADAVEVDVHMTADGQIVALHDEDLLRTGGVDRRIDALTYADLQNIDVGRWKDERYEGERIPELADLLATMPRGKFFFVEIKCGDEIVQEFARVVQAFKSPAKVVPIGLSFPVMAQVKQALPMSPVYGVFECEKTHSVLRCPTTEELIASAREHHFDGVDLDTRMPITRDMVSALKSAGLGVCVWTVDSPQRARELIAAGVEGITTNRPGWLRSELGL